MQDYASQVAPFWHVFGRLGCFAAGCCFGRLTDMPWGVTFTDPHTMISPELLGRALHPAQLYKAPADLVLAAGLYFPDPAQDRERPLAARPLAAAHFAAYGVLRFFMEYFRADVVPLAAGLTAGQGLSLGLLVLAAPRLGGSESRPETMHPHLIGLGAWHISTYGAAVAVAYLIGILWLKTQIQPMGLTEDKFWTLIYMLFFGAIAGGKVLFMAVEWRSYWNGELGMLSDFRFGFVFFGGLLGSMAMGAWAKHRLKFKYLAMADYFGVALPMGHWLGRLGCLGAGCCYGRPTSLPWECAWGRFQLDAAGALGRAPASDPGLRVLGQHRHILLPPQVRAAEVKSGRVVQGTVFLGYVFLYSLTRFFNEYFRFDDRGFTLPPFSPSQWLALGCMLAAGVVMARQGVIKKRKA